MFGNTLKSVGVFCALGSYGTMIAASYLYRASVEAGLTNHDRNMQCAESIFHKGSLILDTTHDRMAAFRRQFRNFRGAN